MVTFRVRFWTNDTDQMIFLKARSEAIKAIDKTFKTNNVTFPAQNVSVDFGITGGPSLREQLEGVNLLVKLPEEEPGGKQEKSAAEEKRAGKEKAHEEKEKDREESKEKEGGETESKPTSSLAHPDRRLWLTWPAVATIRVKLASVRTKLIL